MVVVDRPVDRVDGLGLAQRDRLLPEALGLRHPLDGLRLALGPQDPLLLVTLGPEHGGLPVALGPGDRGLALAVGGRDGGPPGPLGLHLLVHGGRDVGRRVDPLDLHPADEHAPLVGGVVEDLAQLGIDLVAGRQRLVELHVADDVSQVGLRQLGDRHHEIGHVVDEPLGVGRLVVDHRVDGDDHVVGGDDLLWGYVDDLLTHVDQAHGLDERDDDAQARVDGLLVLAELLDDAPLIGADDANARRRIDQQDDGDEHQQDDDSGHLTNSLGWAGRRGLVHLRVRHPVGASP